MNYLGVMTAGNGAILTVRPIGPSDVDRLERMFYRLYADDGVSPLLLTDPGTVAAHVDVVHERRPRPPGGARGRPRERDHRRGPPTTGGRAPPRRRSPSPSRTPGSTKASATASPAGTRLRARPRLRAVHRRHAPREPRGDRPLAPPLDGRPRAVHRRHLLGGGAAVTRELTRLSARVWRPPGGDRWTVAEPVHEPQSGPRVVDCAHLVVDETVGEADIAHDILAEVGRGDVGRLLRPRDP